MRALWIVGALIIGTWFCCFAQGDATGTASREARASVLTNTRFVAYAPGLPFDPFHQPQVPVDEDVVRRELAQLRVYFDGIVTYGLGLGQDCIPRIAEALGYKAVILGIWDPKSAEELDAGVRLVKEYPDLVVGLCIGNEGISVQHTYQLADVQAAIERVRQEVPNVLCTTSEPILPGYVDEPGLQTTGDFLAPNIHPFWALTAGAPMQEAVDWTLRHTKGLAKLAPGKVILVKETGWPSDGRSDCTPARQREYWHLLWARRAEWPVQANFVVFEGCDLPGKAGPDTAFEGAWGVFTANASSRKPVASVFPPLLSEAPGVVPASEGSMRTLTLTAPLLYSGETLMAPMREVAEGLGLTVTAQGNTVTLSYGETRAVLEAGRNEMRVAGKPQTLGAPCALVGETFYAPVRVFVSFPGAVITAPVGTKPLEVRVGGTTWAIPFATSEALTVAGWDSLNARRYDDTLLYARTCLRLYLEAGRQQNEAKGGFIEWRADDSDDTKQRIFSYWALNDCVACEFQIVKACWARGDRETAEAAAKVIKKDLRWGQVWDPRGWFWKPVVSLPMEYPDLDP